MATRGSNPIWSLVDLTGHQFDDTYYMFVLENQIPYIPATVWHDFQATIPWTNPIQFFANGTLPIDIFFDEDIVYRLEFRKGNTQSDPLIYLVENYSPGGNGDTPIDTVSFDTDNQITNAQFSIINFTSPFQLINVTDPDPVEVAPGWFLNLEGTGSVTIERLSINSTLENITNSPYALRLNLSSGDWSSPPYLSQRFNQNGMLWSGKYVSSSVTARIEGARDSISAILVDSMGQTLVNVLPSTSIDSTFNEYRGHGLVPDATNTDVPPDAWIEYRLLLPDSVDIYLSSFQLVVSDTEVEPLYVQDSIERQVDHTFHYYKDSILYLPKNSIITGFNCSLNPWQARTTSSFAIFSQCAYTADQIIVYQQTGASKVEIGRGSIADNYPIEIGAVTSDNRFALIEYIDPSTVRPYWGEYLSSLVRAKITTPHATNVRFKVRLIYRTTLPSTIGVAEPIASWTGSGDPVFSAGWNTVVPQNDPVYTLNGEYTNFPFNKMLLPLSSSDDMTLGFVFYTIDNMDSSIPQDFIQIERASLVPNEFAIDASPLTFDENLRRCQFYYSKSFLNGVVPGVGAGASNATYGIQVSPASTAGAAGPVGVFPIRMRSAPSVILYNPSNTNNEIRDTGSIQDWSNSFVASVGTTGFVTGGDTPLVSNAGNLMAVNWSANARLGQ